MMSNKDLSVDESHIYACGSDNGYGLAMGALNSPASGFLQTMLNHEPAPTGVSIPLLLNPSGGNVGIGTTDPGAKLHVAGDVKIGGNVNNQPCDNSEQYGRILFESDHFYGCTSRGWKQLDLD